MLSFLLVFKTLSRLSHGEQRVPCSAPSWGPKESIGAGWKAELQ